MPSLVKGRRADGRGTEDGYSGVFIRKRVLSSQNGVPGGLLATDVGAVEKPLDSSDTASGKKVVECIFIVIMGGLKRPLRALRSFVASTLDAVRTIAFAEHKDRNLARCKIPSASILS